MSATTVFVDYQQQRTFKHDSRLRAYLAFKKPTSEYIRRDTTTLNQILQYLKEVISQEHLYDKRNASVVICDQNLEEALDCKAMHLTEIRQVQYHHV
jgi:hypothetical protein